MRDEFFSNWFVGALFVALGIAGLLGLFAFLTGTTEGLLLAVPGLGAVVWYGSRYTGVS